MRHAAANGGDDRVARQKIAGRHGFQLAAPVLDLLQRLGQVGVVLEAVVHHDLPAVVPQGFDLNPLFQANPGHRVVAHGDEQVVLVQHLVVLEVVQQRVGHGAGLSRQEHGSAVHPCWWADEDCVDETVEVQRVCAQLFIEQAPALFPGHHEREDGTSYDQREPAAIKQLEQVGAPKRQVHQKEKARGTDAEEQWVFPAVPNDVKGQDSGNQHVGRDRNAVGCRQVAGRAEHHHRQHDGHKQAPVHKRHVDLPGVPHAGVLDVEARQVTQLDDLLGHAERPGNERLRCNDRCHGGQHNQRNQRPVRRHHVKRVFDRLRVVQKQSALAEIVQGQRGHHHGKPRQADRFFAKMAQIGIQRLGARNAQDNRPQQDECRAGVVPHEGQRVQRVERLQNHRVGGDLRHAQRRNHNKPEQRDRPEELANARRPPLLHKKQEKQNNQRQRNDVLMELGRDHLQPLHRAQNRNRRGDDAITIKQASAEDANDQQYPAQARAFLDGLGGQCQHGHQTAFAVVVGPQHEHHVLDGHDHRQRPEENGHDAVHVIRGESDVAGTKDLFDGVQHTGANIAINHANGAQGERGERRFACRHKITLS